MTDINLTLTDEDSKFLAGIQNFTAGFQWLENQSIPIDDHVVGEDWNKIVDTLLSHATTTDDCLKIHGYCGDDDTARKILNKAMELAHDDLDALWGCFLKAEDTEDEIRVFEYVLQACPDEDMIGQLCSELESCSDNVIVNHRDLVERIYKRLDELKAESE